MVVRQYIDSLGQASPGIKRMFLALCLSAAARGVHMVIFNLYLRDLGYTEAFVGQTVSLKALAAVLVLIPAGIVSDKKGRKLVMAGGVLLVGMGLIGVSIVQASIPLLAFSFAFGLGQSIFMVTNPPFIAENSGPRERMHLFSLSWSLMMFSTMLGSVFGGWLADYFEILMGLAPVLSKQITLSLAGVLSIIALFPLAGIREKERARKAGDYGFARRLKESPEKKTIGKFVLASLLLGLGAGLIVPYFNLYFAHVFGLSTGRIGTIMAGGQAAMALAMLVGPPLAQRTGRVPAICALQGGSIIFLLILGNTHLLLLALLAFLIRGGLMNSANPITLNLMMENVSDEMKGTATSLHQLVFQLGWTICGPISGLLIASFSYQLVFQVAAIFYTFSTILFYLMFRGLDRFPEEGGNPSK